MRFAAVTLAVALALVVPHAVLGQKPENSTQVCVAPTAKTDAKDDDYFDKCLEGAAFKGQKANFNFNSAYFKQTTFDDVTFKDETDFSFAFWEGVTFTKCVFNGELNFNQAYMANVVFNDCTFKDRAMFTQITLEKTNFVNCKFEDGAKFELVKMSENTFANTTFDGEETLFDQAGMTTVDFNNVEFKDVRFSFLESSKISITDSTIENFLCHEDLKEGEFVKRRAEFDDLTIASTEIGEIQCDQTVFRGTTFKDLKLDKNGQDFSDSVFTTLTVDGVTGGKCDIDLSESIIRSGEFSGTDSCTINIKDADIGDVTGIDAASEKVNAEGATLPGTKVGDECCVDFCKDNDCLCDIKTEPADGCSKGTSKTNPNLDPADDPKCFPASAMVELEEGSKIPIGRLAVGDSVKVGVDQFSKVFMFTHKLADVESEYVSIETLSGARIMLTGGHYIYADGALVAAARVAPGAALRLADGSISTVTRIQRVAGKWGLYNPQTMQGDIVVDGVIASTYTTAVAPSVAHAVLAPMRALFERFGLGTRVLESGADVIASALPTAV